ncbi:unnamed protein product [Mytilus edulis]|uniref:PHD-type domain-containing protein n=1 Tax=Mytilus edulis TaxID=6550 RepID=A0A8S3QW37_MYTED|nr:unnamed protein product [Mytilus edulis]
MSTKHKTLLILLILLANDIQQNPGPGNRSVFPCGVCEVPVSWSQVGVCCNNCSVWYHKTCGDISSRNMSYLEKSHVVWHCCKCNSINVDSFTYNSFILHTTNMYAPLSGTDSVFDSFTSCDHFSPLHTSSPKTRKRLSTKSTHSQKSSIGNSDKANTNSTRTSSKSTVFTKSTNFRLLTVNCCSINTNKSEFRAAVEYVKPDLICGTESWLKGINRVGTQRKTV